MLFNSIDFAIFLPVVFLLYWFVTNKSLKLQNMLIVAASYLFYGWWDWRFLSLILFSSLVDFSVGIALSKEENETKRKFWLWTSILVNLGFLGFFKYYNFFQDNFITAFSFFGREIQANSLNIILPVGISFYTFQTLSYSIDVYKRKLKPTKDFIAFSAFVTFFPQLVAGPIERATHLLPQFYKKRTFEYSKAVDGMRQILWGLFKKIVIADNCAEYANLIFNNSDDYSGSTLVLGAVFFAFQIYGDFSGYSDIAIGTSRLFGFNLMRTLTFRTFHEILLNSGAVGIFRCPPGSEIICIFHWVEARRYLDESEKYIYYFYCKWFLAWGQLDLYCVGSIECTLFFTLTSEQQQPKSY